MAQFIGQPVQLPAAAFGLPSQLAPLGNQPTQYMRYAYPVNSGRHNM
jgi:hypothetical protein